MNIKNKFQLLLEKKGVELNQIADFFRHSDYKMIDLVDNSLRLQRLNSPIFTIQHFSVNQPFFINRIDKEKKKKVREIRICETKYEVSFQDLNEVLQEYTTLQDIQEVLLTKLGGTIILNWNDSIIE